MLDISDGKVVRIIALAREYGSESRQVRDYIAGLNEDEQVSLVVCAWLGRESFTIDELEEAVETARTERVAPTEEYLSGMPDLASFLEDGMDALGISVAYAEDHLRDRP